MLSFISKILSQHVALLVATRISPCSALSKCCIHSHSGLSTLLHIGLSQHAFLRASHSRNAAYIRIPGYRYFSSSFLSQHAFLRASHSRNAAYIRIPGYRCFSVSFLPQHVLLLVATRISPCSALPKCCIHSHSGLSPYLLMYVCSANRQSTLPASSHVPCDCRTIATGSSRGMCKLHPYAR